MKVGSLLMLSTEQYSDYGYSGPYEVLVEFTFRDILPKVTLMPAPYTEGWRDKPGPEDVKHYLLNNGFVKLLDSTEVHLGSYGDIHVRECLLDV